MTAFACYSIGQTYYHASTRITHLFGSPIEMDPLVGIGTTEAQARERLAKELRDFNDSIWY